MAEAFMRVERRHELEAPSVIGHARAALTEVVQQGFVGGPAYSVNEVACLAYQGRDGSRPAPHSLPPSTLLHRRRAAGPRVSQNRLRTKCMSPGGPAGSPG